jgi:hypothetical protein
LINHRMSRYVPPCVFLLALAVSSLNAQQLPETPDDVDPATPAQVEAPKAPMELPPNPPTVTCKDGQLSIVAENSTMGSVLALVHGCIGAAIDAPLGSSGTRMYAKLGPGPANEILQSLLSSTDFDYVIEPSPSNPHLIQTVMLMARTKDGKEPIETDRSLTPQRRAWLEARHNARPYDEINDESHALSDGETAPVIEPSAPMPGTPLPDNAPPPANKSPDAASLDPSQQAGKLAATPDAPPQANTDASTTDPASDSPAAKAVQDKVTTMQQMFEQRKQLNQGQTPPQSTTPQ